MEKANYKIWVASHNGKFVLSQLIHERELTHERESLSLSVNLGQAALQESGSSNLVATLSLGFLNLYRW